MRILIVLLALVVFAACFLFDTAGLVDLTLSCASGGCGFRPIWFAIPIGLLIAGTVVSGLRSKVSAPVAKKRAPRAKAAPARKPKSGKSRPRPRAPRKAPADQV